MITTKVFTANVIRAAKAFFLLSYGFSKNSRCTLCSIKPFVPGRSFLVRLAKKRGRSVVIGDIMVVYGDKAQILGTRRYGCV